MLRGAPLGVFIATLYLNSSGGGTITCWPDHCAISWKPPFLTPNSCVGCLKYCKTDQFVCDMNSAIAA